MDKLRTGTSTDRW